MVDINFSQLRNGLIKAGFSEKTALIYLALLELGEGSVISIAKKSHLKRTTVYNLLPDLIERGYIQTAIKQKRRKFYIEDVQQIQITADQQQRSIESLIPHLKARHNIIPRRPNVIFFEGAGGAEAFFKDTLKNSLPGEAILEIIGPDAFYSQLPDGLMNSYVPERIKRGISIKIIASPSPIANELLLRAKKELREIRIYNNSNIKFKAATIIYGNRVGYISLKENFLGVIIQSDEISQMQKASFNLMWDSLK